MKDMTNTQILDGIMRQHNLWPSTFGGCCNSEEEGEHTSARGGGFCLYCYQRELERRIGKDGRIYDFSENLSKTCSLYHELLKIMPRGEEL